MPITFYNVISWIRVIRSSMLKTITTTEISVKRRIIIQHLSWLIYYTRSMLSYIIILIANTTLSSSAIQTTSIPFVIEIINRLVLNKN